MKNKISVGLCLIVVLAAILITFSVTFACVFQGSESETTQGASTESSTADTVPSDPDLYFDVDKLQQIIEKFDKESVIGFDKDIVTDAFLKGFIAFTKDSYAAYMTAEEFEAFNDSNQGNYVGIGITVQYDDKASAVRVVEVTPDSPAFDAGFQPYDYLVAVNGKKPDGNLSAAELVDTFADMIRGEEETDVDLTILRDGKEMTLTATRRRITTQSVRYRLCEYNGKKAAFITIRSFDYPAITQFKDAIDSAEKDGVDYIVYDLRNNGGGLLSSVTTMLTYLVKDETLLIETEYLATAKTELAGKYVSSVIENADSLTPYLEVNNSLVKYNQAYADHTVEIPSAVLVNGGTASAAELFCAVLRDYKLATTVGENTYGKGCMQVTYSFLDGTALKLTTAFYNPPCGINYDRTTEGPVGIAPDVEVIFTEEENRNSLYLLPPNEDRQFVAAFNALTDGEKLPIPSVEKAS